LLVEVVTTVLLLLGLRWLPKRMEEMDAGARRTAVARARRLRDFVIAVVAGTGLSALAYAVMTRPMPSTISRFFVAHAYPGGGGTNIVNVILVDFRGFDTLGEITVLAVVALAVFALLRRFRPAPESIGPTRQQRRQQPGGDGQEPLHIDDAVPDYLAVPATLVQLLFPFAVLLALFFLVRGHNLPGGGFVAGITLAVAFILQYMTMGIRQTEARLRIHPLRWMATGLLLAAGTGTGAWLFSHPFLTSHHAVVELPWVGEVPVASAIVFDVGVFALVVGATALILTALAHQSIRSERPPDTSGTPPGAEEQ
ncbi:MAG TPA: hydrogen gas-evolving membrane-bound hydrogenase subunit E, partial [Luteimonas sp.]|nr:hydrogen gas-evolving membrane-bound hydrogenase subunit E [Luteimonas sp.]